MKYSAALDHAEPLTARQLADRILSLPVGELLHAWRPGVRQTSVVDAHVDVTYSGGVYISGRAPGRNDRFRAFQLHDVDGAPTVFGTDRHGHMISTQRRIER